MDLYNLYGLNESMSRKNLYALKKTKITYMVQKSPTNENVSRASKTKNK